MKTDKWDAKEKSRSRDIQRIVNLHDMIYDIMISMIDEDKQLTKELYHRAKRQMKSLQRDGYQLL